MTRSGIGCNALLDRKTMEFGMKIISRIEPQPPNCIKYMLGGETWKPEAEQTPIRLHCEEWGNLGPMELDPEIQDNGHGFRVRSTERIAPPGALGFTRIDGVYYWTDTDCWGRDATQRSNDKVSGG